MSDSTSLFETIIAGVTANTDGLMGEEGGIRVPVMKIVHPASMGKDWCPEEARPGDLCIAGTTFGSSVEFVPVLGYKGRIKFDGDTSMIDCSSLDTKKGSKYGACADCEHLPWRDGQRTACFDNINVFGVVEHQGEYRLVKATFSKTSLSAGKALFRLAKRDARPLWAKRFVLSTVKKQANGRSWLQYDIALSATPVAEELVQAGFKLKGAMEEDYNQLKQRLENRGLAQIEEPKIKQLENTESEPEGETPSFDI
jgi:hypothetical protein